MIDELALTRAIDWIVDWMRLKPNDEFVAEKIVETIDHLRVMLLLAAPVSPSHQPSQGVE
jgi:hypothetical protein